MSVRSNTRLPIPPSISGGSTPPGQHRASRSFSANFQGCATGLGIACARMRRCRLSYSWGIYGEWRGRLVTSERVSRCCITCPALRHAEGPRERQLIWLCFSFVDWPFVNLSCSFDSCIHSIHILLRLSWTYSPSITMSTTVTEVKPSKANIGVYTNPAHDLWVAEAEPSLEVVQKGGDLKEGEVLLNVKSTGICGSDIHFWHAVCLSLTLMR
jgi:hypothetical protein